MERQKHFFSKILILTLIFLFSEKIYIEHLDNKILNKSKSAYFLFFQYKLHPQHLCQNQFVQKRKIRIFAPLKISIDIFKLQIKKSADLLFLALTCSAFSTKPIENRPNIFFVDIGFSAKKRLRDIEG